MELRTTSLFLLSFFFVLSSPPVAPCFLPAASYDGIPVSPLRLASSALFSSVPCRTRKCKQTCAFPASKGSSHLPCSFLSHLLARLRTYVCARSCACRTASSPPSFLTVHRPPEARPTLRREQIRCYVYPSRVSRYAFFAPFWLSLDGARHVATETNARSPRLVPLSQQARSTVPSRAGRRKDVAVVESFLPLSFDAKTIGRHGPQQGKRGENQLLLFASGDGRLTDSGEDGAAMERIEKEEVSEEETTTQEKKKEEKEIEDDQKKQAERRERLKAWQVVLHNDDIHAIPHVTDLLVDAVPSLTKAKAHSITVHAHKTGLALILRTWREKAVEIYRKLKASGLTISLVPSKRKDKQEGGGESDGTRGMDGEDGGDNNLQDEDNDDSDDRD